MADLPIIDTKTPKTPEEVRLSGAFRTFQNTLHNGRIKEALAVLETEPGIATRQFSESTRVDGEWKVTNTYMPVSMLISSLAEHNDRDKLTPLLAKVLHSEAFQALPKEARVAILNKHAVMKAPLARAVELNSPQAAKALIEAGASLQKLNAEEENLLVVIGNTVRATEDIQSWRDMLKAQEQWPNETRTQLAALGYEKIILNGKEQDGMSSTEQMALRFEHAFEVIPEEEQIPAVAPLFKNGMPWNIPLMLRLLQDHAPLEDKSLTNHTLSSLIYLPHPPGYVEKSKLFTTEKKIKYESERQEWVKRASEVVVSADAMLKDHQTDKIQAPSSNMWAAFEKITQHLREEDMAMPQVKKLLEVMLNHIPQEQDHAQRMSLSSAVAHAAENKNVTLLKALLPFKDRLLDNTDAINVAIETHNDVALTQAVTQFGAGTQGYFSVANKNDPITVEGMLTALRKAGEPNYAHRESEWKEGKELRTEVYPLWQMIRKTDSIPKPEMVEAFLRHGLIPDRPFLVNSKDATLLEHTKELAQKRPKDAPSLPALTRIIYMLALDEDKRNTDKAKTAKREHAAQEGSFWENVTPDMLFNRLSSYVSPKPQIAKDGIPGP